MSWENLFQHVDKLNLPWAERSAEFECPKRFDKALDDLEEIEEDEEEADDVDFIIRRIDEQ